MSSDNYWLIRKRGGRFYLTMEFASDERPAPIMDADQSFDTLEEAVRATEGRYTEYGLTVDASVSQGEAWDQRGRRVREVWIAWAREQPNPKPSWLVPWDELTEPEREVDRRIGSALWGDGFADGMASMTSAQTLFIEAAARAEVIREVEAALSEQFGIGHTEDHMRCEGVEFDPAHCGLCRVEVRALSQGGEGKA